MPRASILAALLLLAACAAAVVPRTDEPDAPVPVAAGDVLRIEVFGEDKLTGTYTVDREGRFEFPLIGLMTARGLTPDEIEAEFDNIFSPYFRPPQVMVVVIECAACREAAASAAALTPSWSPIAPRSPTLRQGV